MPFQVYKCIIETEPSERKNAWVRDSQSCIRLATCTKGSLSGKCRLDKDSA